MSKNTITARTEKNAATEEELRASLEEAYPDYHIAEVRDLGTEWEGVLEKDFEHTAALPFEKDDSGGDDSGGDKPKEKKPKEKSEKSKEKSEPSDDEAGDLSDGPSDEGDSDGDDFVGPSDGPSGADPLKDIHHLLSELTEKVKQLEEKAGLVDDIHQKIKPHIEDGSEIGPTAPGGGNPMGGPPGGPGGPPGAGGPPAGPGGPGAMPGGLGDGAGGPAGGPPSGPPSIPRRPTPAKGFDRRIRDPRRGLPSAFTNFNPNQKIVHVPIKANGTEYTMTEALDAVKSDEKYSNYRIAGIQEDLRNGRYAIKLVK